MSDDDHGRQWDISPSSSLSPKLQDMPLPAQKSCKNRRRRGKYMLFQDKRRLQPAEAWYTYVSPRRLEMAPGEDTCETCLLGVRYVQYMLTGICHHPIIILAAGGWMPCRSFSR
jgi:hypothetical protein